MPSLVEKVRIRNYINLYKGNGIMSKEKTLTKFQDLNQKCEKIEETMNISRKVLRKSTIIKINTQNVTKISDSCVYTKDLERKSNEIVYDIQKAQSDKLELMRDIATYEKEFSDAYNLRNVLDKINYQSSNLLPESNLFDDVSPMVSKIQKGFYDIEEDLCTICTYATECENFELKKTLYSKAKQVLFSGSFLISDIPCVVKIYGTKWLEEMDIWITTMENLTFYYFLKHNLSTLYHNEKELLDMIRKQILSKFYFIIFSQNSVLNLMYDSMHNDKFKVVIYIIRGYGKCSLSLRVLNSKLNIEVLEARVVLEVPAEVLKIRDINDVSLKFVRNIVKDHIYYDKYTKEFFWQDDADQANVYSNKEQNSNFLNEDYLKEALSMKSFKLLYSFSLTISDHQFHVELQAFKDQKKIVIFYGHEAIEIPQESKHFRLLNDLQVINVISCPITVQKSLEMNLFIKKQFPRLFTTKNK
ncbi:hypothetical protein SteCoe_34564 [Stentor coeruleus]|uniref:Uncharacterized protein n=1 Tax=Stentor coeruleus TaxID=5963 RepID=A0A1R2AU81_9CILI|nr:hypothetical protein SteCoe_34564 [Stentor coeruleus]